MKEITLKHRLIIGLLFITLIWIYYIVMIFTEGAKEKLFILVILSVTTAVIVLWLVRENSKNRKLMELLEQDCSPEAFVMETRTMLAKEKKKKNSRKKEGLLICIGVGLNAMGRYEEALCEMNSDHMPQKRCTKRNLAEYYHCLFLNYVELGRLDMAEDALADMKEATKTTGDRRLKNKYKQDVHLLNIARGNYENAKGIFLEEYSKARTKYERVCAAYILGVICSKIGSDEDAKEAFEYVVENGNKLHIVKLATEQLGLSAEQR